MKRFFHTVTGSALLAVTALLVAPTVVHAATTIVVQRGKQGSSTIYADGDHLRMDLGGAAPTALGKGFVIIDAAARKMVMVHDRDKTYTEITEDDMKKMKGQMQAARAQMADRMKNMTPEQRAKMEAMLGPGAAQMIGGGSDKPHAWKFEPLGGTKVVNGFSCETYRVLLDGVAHEEDCISPWSAGLVKRAEFAALEKFGENMSQDLGFGPNGGAMPLFHQYPGMPIVRVVLEPGGVRGEEHQVKSITHGAISPSLFAVPAGYTKRELPQPGMRRGAGAGPGPEGRRQAGGAPPPPPPP
jgi:hypothetical protein